ncbi:MAG: class A beta-lactamase [Mycobacterium sp.]
MNRRHFLAAAVLTAGCGRTVTPPRLSDPAEPLPPIEDRIGLQEDKYNAVVGLWAVNLNSGRTLAHRDGDMLAVCSTFKAYLAARVLQLAQQGSLKLTDTVYVDPASIVTHSPLTQPHAGAMMPLSALCEAVLQQSDNTAANLLLDQIGGPPAITAFARSIGDEKTRLDRWETELNAAIPGDPRDTSTPRALGGGFQTLLTGTVLDEVHRRRLEDWMRGNQTSARSMRAGLPPGWTTADKTGAGDYGSTNDIGIAYGPAGERILLSVMTRTRTDDPKAANLQPLIGDITALVLPWLLGKI